MYELFVDRLMNLFGGQVMTKEIASKIAEMRKDELNRIEEEVRQKVSGVFGSVRD